MVYIKVDSEFMPIELLAEISTVPVNQIEEFINKGISFAENSAQRVFPEVSSSLRRIKNAVKLYKMNLQPDLKKDLMSLINSSSYLSKETFVEDVQTLSRVYSVDENSLRELLLLIDDVAVEL